MDFLNSMGVPADRLDAWRRYREVEGSAEINVERYFQYLWTNIDRYGRDEYENILRHGIYDPILTFMITRLWGDGEWKPFDLSDSVAARLHAGDLVLNLNYDTVFDLALARTGADVTYLPNTPTPSAVVVAKPHGSLNLVVNPNRGSFFFATADSTGGVPRHGEGVEYGLVPPRLAKEYVQHPIAAAILAPARSMRPTRVTFWGIGLTESDTDLLALYRQWARFAQKIEFINPDVAAWRRCQELLRREVEFYANLDRWLISAWPP